MELSYQYDGSWYGLLTAIFEAFDRKEEPISIYSSGEKTTGLFEKVRVISTDVRRAKRVEKGLKKASYKSFVRIFKIFLSEKKDRAYLSLQLSRLVFKNSKKAELDFANTYVLKVKQIEKEVDREVHRMHAFVRFQSGKDNIWYAFIKPDFNVMPLIQDHFERRYADQQWVIYDLRRNYGVYYDLVKTEYISLDFYNDVKSGRLPDSAISEDEVIHQELWQNYFESVNIKERKNMRLHVQHVPLRYWSLLTEKKKK